MWPGLQRLVFGLVLLAMLVSCKGQRISEEELGPVRVLERLPSGIACEKIEHVSLRDGSGCGYMGGSRQAQRETLFYNLKQQARKRQANVVVLDGEPQPETWEGCPSNGLVAEANLYRCDFSVSH